MRYYAAIMCVTLLERESRGKLAQKDGRAGGALPCLLAIMLPEAWEHWVGWSGLGWAGHGSEDTTTQRQRCL